MITHSCTVKNSPSTRRMTMVEKTAQHEFHDSPGFRTKMLRRMSLVDKRTENQLSGPFSCSIDSSYFPHFRESSTTRRTHSPISTDDLAGDKREYGTSISKDNLASQIITHNKADRIKRVLLLCFFCVSNISARRGAVLIAQLFKPGTGYSLWGERHLSVPWLLALAPLLSCPIMLTIWFAYSKHRFGRLRIRNRKYRLKMYAIISALEAIRSSANAFSINTLTISMYAVLKGSSLIFTLIIFRVFTTKIFNILHYLGIGLVAVGSGMMVAFAGSNTESTQLALGLSCGIVSALAVSFISLATQLFYSTQNSKRDLYDVIEFAAFQVTGACLLVMPVAVGVEHSFWAQIPSALAVSERGLEFVGSVIALIGLFPISFLSLVCIVSYSSSMFTRVLSSIRQPILIGLSAIVFHEALTPISKIASIVVGILGTVVYMIGGFYEEGRKRAIEAKTVPEHIAELSTTEYGVETEKKDDYDLATIIIDPMLVIKRGEQ